MSTIKKKGIDISVWQGTVDFAKVKGSGVEFVNLRVGSSQKVDSKFFEYVKQCKEVGLPVLGVYHFSYAFNTAGAIAEAQLAISLVEKAGLSKDTIIFYDFEYDTVDQAKKYGVNLKPANCVDHTRAFCETVKAAGYPTGIYANVDYCRNWYNPQILNEYDLWLADWRQTEDVYPCIIRQYSSTGKVPGINTAVDMNYLYEAAVPVVPPTKKTSVEIAEDVPLGLWGNGDARKKSIEAAGYNYEEIQIEVNRLLYSKVPPKKSISEIAQEVLQGKWGNGGDRKKRLTEAGYDYNKVQVEVTQLLKK